MGTDRAHVGQPNKIYTAMYICIQIFIHIYTYTLSCLWIFMHGQCRHSQTCRPRENQCLCAVLFLLQTYTYIILCIDRYMYTCRHTYIQAVWTVADVQTQSTMHVCCAVAFGCRSWAARSDSKMNVRFVASLVSRSRNRPRRDIPQTGCTGGVLARCLLAGWM